MNSLFLTQKGWLALALLCFSLFINLIFILRPLQGKSWLSKIYKKPLKQTLRIMEGTLIEAGIKVRVLKIKEGGKIYLQFLSKQPDNSFFLINKVELQGRREAYYRYWRKEKEMYSLLLFDDDGDGRLDVIAPAFDQLFIPQNNIAAYNQKTKQFELKPNSNYSQVARPAVWPKGYFPPSRD